MILKLSRMFLVNLFPEEFEVSVNIQKAGYKFE